MQQDWHFSIKGEVVYGDQLLHLHPANFVNLIRIFDYHDRIMPVTLTRLQVDKNLLDYIVQHAETCEIKMNITKFMMSRDRLETSPPETMVDDIFQVSVGTDINYNKELDYVESQMSELPSQDKFKETYLGLVSKACMNASKLVVNEVIKDSMMQDVVLSYLLTDGKLHPLIEPFDHNEKLEQTIVPPTDSLYATIDYFNSIKVFYDTRYILFIDEPNVTYLLSKSGKAVPMKGEKFNTVELSMRGPKDAHNLTIGMNNDGHTQAYQADISVFDSVYKIDKDTVKMVDSIGAVLNPDISLSKVNGDTVSQYKRKLNQEKKSFILDVLMKTMAVGDIALKMSYNGSKMNNAVDRIRKVTSNLQTTVKSSINDIINRLPGQVLEGTSRSVLKSFMDSRFVTCDINLNTQQNVKSNFSRIVESTASEHYKMDFLDNMASSVTYVNLPDTRRATDMGISSLYQGTNQVVSDMSSNVTNRMGSFPNLTNSLGDMVDKVSGWESKLLKLIAQSSSSGSGSWGYSGQSSQNDLYQQLLNDVQREKLALTVMHTQSDKYGTIANQAYNTVNNSQTNLSGYARNFLSYSGSVGSINPYDIKSQFVSTQQPVTFGNLDLGQIMQTTMGGCFGTSEPRRTGYSLGSLANLDLGNIARKVVGGIVSFANLGELKNNLSKFNIGEIGKLGLGHIAFNLNLGRIPGLGEVSGTKLLKVRNDNPNELKNIKSEIEMNKNKLSFNKFGMDPSVFTPNKRYIIKNYSAHENKDGVFILKKKIEVYTREDNTFVCNTYLEFVKADETPTTAGVTNISTANPNAPG